MMTNINYEIKSLEKIQVEIAEAVFRSIKGAVIEASEQEFSNRWNDIVNAVLEANPAIPAAVSPKDQLVAQMEQELNDLRAENFQLQSALLGASCKLPDCPVRRLEETGVISVDEWATKATKAVMDAELGIEEHVQKAVEEANKVKMPSLMDELDDPTSEIEDSFWDDDDDSLLLLDDDSDDSFEPEEDSLLSDETDDSFEPEEDSLLEDPFAVDTETEDKVLDVLSGHEEFDPFSVDVDDSDSQFDDSDIDFTPFADEDVPPASEAEEEESKSEPAGDTSGLPSKSSGLPSKPAGGIAPLKKDEVRVVTYKVFDKEVEFVQANAYINGVKNKSVKDMAFMLHNVMLQKNEGYKTFTQAERDLGKFYTQMIREWGLEIAAANNIERVKGDDGCAILIAELFYSMHTENQNLISPVLRSRNEEEKKAAEKLFNQLESNRGLVDDYKNDFALDPMMFVGTKKLDKENTFKAGYALLRARMDLTWKNATGKKTVCVFPEVTKFNIKKGAI